MRQDIKLVIIELAKKNTKLRINTLTSHHIDIIPKNSIQDFLTHINYEMSTLEKIIKEIESLRDD